LNLGLAAKDALFVSGSIFAYILVMFATKDAISFSGKHILTHLKY